MFKNAEMRAGELAPKVLQLVQEDPKKAYPGSISKRLKARGERTHGIEVKNSMEFLKTEGMLIALPPVKINQGQPCQMYMLTPKGKFHLASLVLAN